MVRVLVAVLFAVLAALPAMAQDDYPRIEMSLGYANMGFPCCSGNNLGDNTRHSGFASTQGFNLTRRFGIENYFGYYSLGNRVNLLSNLFGGKVAARRFERAVPYFTAGIGVGYLTDSSGYYGYGSAFGTRFGPGVDLKFNDSMALKVDFSRMSYHFGQLTPTSSSWWSGWNLKTGVVFVLSQ